MNKNYITDETWLSRGFYSAEINRWRLRLYLLGYVNQVILGQLNLTVFCFHRTHKDERCTKPL